MDAVAILFEAVGEGGVAAKIVGAAQGAFVAGGDVVVLVDGGLADEEDEEVRVAAVAEAGGGVGAELLLDGGEVALGALPRRVGAVEEVSAVGTVAGGEEDVGGSCFCLQPGLAGCGVGGVVAIGDEAVGLIAAGGELLGEGAGGVCGAEVVFE